MSGYPDSHPVAWYSRPMVVAGLTGVAIAWAVYLVLTVVGDPDLSSLEEASGYEFRFDPWLLVAVVVIAMVIPAIVCFFKGKAGMGLIGLVVPVVSLVGAVRPAKAGSLWARRFSVENRRVTRLAGAADVAMGSAGVPGLVRAASSGHRPRRRSTVERCDWRPVTSLRLPDYAGGSLVNLVAELEHRLTGNALHPGLHRDVATLIPDAATYVLVLFDGLGDGQLTHPAAAPLLCVSRRRHRCRVADHHHGQHGDGGHRHDGGRARAPRLPGVDPRDRPRGQHHQVDHPMG